MADRTAFSLNSFDPSIGGEISVCFVPDISSVCFIIKVSFQCVVFVATEDAAGICVVVAEILFGADIRGEEKFVRRCVEDIVKAEGLQGGVQCVFIPEFDGFVNVIDFLRRDIFAEVAWSEDVAFPVREKVFRAVGASDALQCGVNFFFIGGECEPFTIEAAGVVVFKIRDISFDFHYFFLLSQ